MCGIAGAINLRGETVPDLDRRLAAMSALIAHRGPDGHGTWAHPNGHVGFAHRRLSIFDLTEHGRQPMAGPGGRVVTYNGEIYNWPEVRAELGGDWRTATDTEVLLRAHERWGHGAVDRLRGMFAYGLWDEQADELLLVRDRFGIKPLYYAQVGDVLCFASEAKALLPFLPAIETDRDGLKDYLAFQFCLAGKTLFAGVRELLPGHRLRIRNGTVTNERYWEVYYDLDWDHRETWFEERVEALLHDSVRLHLRSDVPVGAYVSGGLDSSAVAGLASIYGGGDPMRAFTGRFLEGPEYDESSYARIVAEERGLDLSVIDIGSDDFVREIARVVYHLDFPVAGPGSFPQFMVSQAAARDVKVILGGQGGDEVFGGYTRYLIAYFEQCIKAAIEGTADNGNFVVTYESIIPQLQSLRNYKPMLREFWREGLFEDLDRRYFRLVNRAPDVERLVRIEGDYDPFHAFSDVFNGPNVGHESYFDKMTHFDFKTLLPALLQVEDRVSMAHGLESRVPLLDHPLVELAATIPADVKFPGGRLKHVFARATRAAVPEQVARRKDKMGFPVPLVEWARGDARDYVHDVFSTERELFDNRSVLAALDGEAKFGRTFWGLFSLELWQQTFHDRARELRAAAETAEPEPAPERTP